MVAITYPRSRKTGLMDAPRTFSWICPLGADGGEIEDTSESMVFVDRTDGHDGMAKHAAPTSFTPSS